MMKNAQLNGGIVAPDRMKFSLAKKLTMLASFLWAGTCFPIQVTLAGLLESDSRSLDRYLVFDSVVGMPAPKEADHVFRKFLEHAVVGEWGHALEMCSSAVRTASTAYSDVRNFFRCCVPAFAYDVSPGERLVGHPLRMRLGTPLKECRISIPFVKHSKNFHVRWRWRVKLERERWLVDFDTKEFFSYINMAGQSIMDFEATLGMDDPPQKEAYTVFVDFIKAIQIEDWTTALFLCSGRVVEAVRDKKNNEAFLQNFIPVDAFAKNNVLRVERWGGLVQLTPPGSSLLVCWGFQFVQSNGMWKLDFEPVPISEDIGRITRLPIMVQGDSAGKEEAVEKARK